MNSSVLEEEGSVIDFMTPVFRRWRTVGLIVLIAVGLVFARLAFAVPEYEARARLIVLAPNEAVSDLQTLQLYRNLVPAYQEVLRSRRVMNAVLKEVGLGWSPADYERRVRVEADDESQTLEVLVRANSPAEAARIATGAAEVMIRVAAQVMQEERLVLLDPAVPPENPVSPRVAVELSVAVIMGLIVGSGVAFALEVLDRRIRDEDDVERRLGLPVLGAIPHIDL